MTNDRFRQLVNSLLDVVFPQYCLNCGASGELLCEKCLTAAPRPEPVCFNCETASQNGICPECARRFHIGNTHIFWATSYKYEPIRQLIRALKYRHADSASVLFASLIYSRIWPSDIVVSGNPIILPVPMHPARLRERGNNHAALLARALTRLSGAKMFEDVLVKTHPTHSQVEARFRAERLKNLAGSFAVHDAEKIAGQDIILVDDVLTTGATMIECAKVLCAAGARSITVFVVAH